MRRYQTKIFGNPKLFLAFHLDAFQKAFDSLYFAISFFLSPRWEISLAKYKSWSKERGKIIRRLEEKKKKKTQTVRQWRIIKFKRVVRVDLVVRITVTLYLVIFASSWQIAKWTSSRFFFFFLSMQLYETHPCQPRINAPTRAIKKCTQQWNPINQVRKS